MSKNYESESPYKNRRVAYSIPGAIIGGVVGAVGGTAGSIYGLNLFTEDRELSDTTSFLLFLLIPTALALGGGIGAYLGGRIFGKKE